MNKSGKRKKPSIGKMIAYVFLSLWAATTLYPLVWVVINAFKDRRIIRTDSFSIPVGSKATLDNFRLAFDKLNILGAYKNSLIISCTVMLVVMLLAGFAAFALVRYHFRGKQFLYSIVIAGMMFPIFSTIIPVFRMMNVWGIVNTDSVPLSLFATALPQIAGNMSFAIVVLVGYIKSLPIDLEEAAYIEGCNVYKIYFKVVMPLTKPSFATVAIFTFLWSYNDLFTQMFTLRYKNQWAITRLLGELTSMEGTNYGLMASAVTLVIIPVMIIYLCLQKYIVKGLTAGALKG